MAKRGKESSGAIVKRAAPLEHTASSLGAFQYLQALWGGTAQATLRKALEEAARAAYWPGPSSDAHPTTSEGGRNPSDGSVPGSHPYSGNRNRCEESERSDERP
jgi:hypothetical protein